MHNNMSLQTLLGASHASPGQQLALFALLTLGIIESLAHGLLSVTDVLRVFFHTDNCLYVRKHLRDKIADAVMSHGVQLPDLFEVLSHGGSPSGVSTGVGHHACAVPQAA